MKRCRFEYKSLQCRTFEREIRKQYRFKNSRISHFPRNSSRSATKPTSAMDTKSEAHRSRIALRCAKAALLLASLKNRTRTTSAAADQDHEALEMEKVVMSLKVDLARERMRLREVKLCGVLEMMIQVMVLISVWTFVLVLACN